MFKYPRTKHLEGSRVQYGDIDSHVPFDELKGRHLVVEEKMDGSNVGISFQDGVLMLQSRGHYLIGGDYPHFSLFKQWAAAMSDNLWELLRDEYVMYGEWLYAKHAIHYDALPHFFMEFDMLRKADQVFIDTPRREALMGRARSPISRVRVLAEGRFTRLQDIVSLAGASAFISDGGLMEGLYIKVEEAGEVVGRYKWIRPEFMQRVVDMGEHWVKMPVVANGLAWDADIWRSEP